LDDFFDAAAFFIVVSKIIRTGADASGRFRNISEFFMIA
jgi:hypothetical protein